MRKEIMAALANNNVEHYDIAYEENMSNIHVVIGNKEDAEMITDAVVSVFCDDETAEINTLFNDRIVSCIVSYE